MTDDLRTRLIRLLLPVELAFDSRTNKVRTNSEAALIAADAVIRELRMTPERRGTNIGIQSSTAAHPIEPDPLVVRWVTPWEDIK